jgi:hypothetical protein
MTGTDQINDRHLTAAGINKYINRLVPVELPIAGRPKVSIFIHPDTPEMGLRVHDTGDARLPQTNLRHVVTRATLYNGTKCLEIVVTVAWLFRDAYPLLCAIADRVQLDGLRPFEAVRLSLQQLSMLLRQNNTFSKDQEIGLMGELLTLSGLVDVLGFDEAIASWLGGKKEEHDFRLSEADLEVKTTTTEHRSHWITSLTQFVATVERPLWLVSHQLTEAGSGGGSSLSELVEKIRRSGAAGTARDALERGLEGAGWSDDLISHCTTRWTKRAESRAYTVSGEFPRLTPDQFAALGIDALRVSEVKYRINLDGLAHAEDPPQVIRAAISCEGQA